MTRPKNYNCSKCDDLVHAYALPDSIIKTGLCYKCWKEKLEADNKRVSPKSK